MDVQTATVVIAGIGVIIGVINSIVSSRRAERTAQLALETRQAQLFMQLYNRWNSPDVIKAYGYARYMYDKPEEFDEFFSAEHAFHDLDTYARWQMLVTYFEGLGILVKKQLIDIDMVDDLFSNRILWWWDEYMKPYFLKFREHIKDPTMYDSIESLTDEIKMRRLFKEQEQRRHMKPDSS
jgi:hypothetical protein